MTRHLALLSLLALGCGDKPDPVDSDGGTADTDTDTDADTDSDTDADTDVTEVHPTFEIAWVEDTLTVDIADGDPGGYEFGIAQTG